eukprot:gene35308-39938_t
MLEPLLLQRRERAVGLDRLQSSAKAFDQQIVRLRAERHIAAAAPQLGQQQADPLQSMVDDAPRHVSEHLDPNTWPLALEISAEAARNPKIAEVVHDADQRSRGQFRAILKASREQKGLPVDDDTMDGLVEAMICLFQGLDVRVVHNPKLNEAALAHRMSIAMKAMLFS